MAEPPLEGRELQEAVEAFLRSPMPASPSGISDSWVPDVTDAEEPTVIDAVVEHEPWVLFTPEGAGVATTTLADGSQVIAIDDGPPGDESPAIDLAEVFNPGCRVRLFGRWANVHLEPEDDDVWNGRMFVIEQYEHDACPAHPRR